MRKIEAVKIIRQHTACGLLEAKRAIDEIVKTGCLGVSEDHEQEMGSLRMERDRLTDGLSRTERRHDVMVDVIARLLERSY